MISSANAKLEARLRLYLRLTAFVDIEKTWLGKLKDASLGLTLEGSMDSSLVMSISGKIRFVRVWWMLIPEILFDLLQALALLLVISKTVKDS